MKKSRNHKELETVLSNLNAARADPDDGFVILSQSDADFLADRLNVYISGNVNTLDEAFGLKRGRGAPQNGPIYPHNMEMARKALFRGKKSWNDIASELGADPRTLQRLVKRHEQHAIESMASELVRHMNEKDRIEKNHNTLSVTNSVI
ncbi:MULTISPECIES: hypothetical protein [Brucella]|uniref:Uncharacterized protein n=4 Tax=Brucella TaxID=234 RepID=Q57FD1_BRUAB|nr:MULTISPECIES: hypothetical protein [Brucella]ERM86940.1 hypothetical protein P865_05500 [Brucella abortus 82]ERT85786.1 hypothetical protein P050_00963 [Brucella abortus 90-12178]ERT99096.1 hypothetical protein P038_01947 [Brucella abortus 99-9971-135]ERU11409.1 hypothetical protein P039_00104 [Brucella abortus 07-0994-2411]EXU84784.1 hypothetical protein AX23_04505 [Brucella melitensis 548]KFH22983.1 hypothetical protein IB63_06215 [Brucella abortus 544]